MTLSTTAIRADAIGPSAILTLPVPFQFFAATDLEVIERDIASGVETVKALGTDYTVSGGNGSTGTVTSVAAVFGSVQWTVRRATVQTQSTDLPVNDPFPSETVEQRLDRLTMMIQELQEQAGRSPHFPRTDAAALVSEVAGSVARANKVLMFDASGNATVGDFSASIAATTLLVVSAIDPGHVNGRLWIDTSVALTNIVRQSDGAQWTEIWRVNTFADQLLLAGVAMTALGNQFQQAQGIFSSDSGAGEVAGLDLERGSLSPAANDALMTLRWLSRDSGGGVDIAAKLLPILLDPSAGSEDARLEIWTLVAGTTARRTYVGQGVVVGNPVGGDPGLGKLNAEDLQINGIAVQSIVDANGANKNLVINGNLDVWQRGTSGSAPAGSRTFGPDRIYINPAGAAVAWARAVVSPQLDRQAHFLLQLTGAASVAAVLVGTRLPQLGHRRAVGVVTVSAYINNQSGAAFTPTLLLGTPGALNDFTAVTNRLTQALQNCPNNAWTRVSFTVDTSGYTNILNGLQAELQIPAGALDSGVKLVYFAELQIEANASFSGFEATDFTEQLERCRPYYWKSFPYATAPAQNAGLTGALRGIAGLAGAVASRFFVRWPAPLIKAPTLTLYNPAAANAQVRNVTDGADHTASGIVGDADQAVITSTGLAGTAIGEELAVHVTADAEL